MKLVCCPPDRVASLWPAAKDLVSGALERGNSDLGIDAVYKKLIAGVAMLSVIIDDDMQILAAAVTEIISFVGSEDRVCMLTAWATRPNIDISRDFLPRFEQYAKEENCKTIRLYGREGWSRFLRNDGYYQPYVVLEKKVS